MSEIIYKKGSNPIIDRAISESEDRKTRLFDKIKFIESQFKSLSKERDEIKDDLWSVIVEELVKAGLSKADDYHLEILDDKNIISHGLKSSGDNKKTMIIKMLSELLCD